jgi:predicted DNA-binding transcriptional regulator YafY
MRRADRLFRLVLLLRRGRVKTASQLAAKLEVSERTIYRDIQDLADSGVPIQGEAGVGYLLGRDFDLPPLMFSPEEIEALVLGARIVASWSDRSLGAAAERVVAKVEAALPEPLKSRIERTFLFSPMSKPQPAAALEHLAATRTAISEQKKMRLTYRPPGSAAAQRTVQPLALFFWGTVWTLVGWCELRDDFRSFRLDRMENVLVTEEVFASAPGRTLDDFFLYVAAHAGERQAKHLEGEEKP